MFYCTLPDLELRYSSQEIVQLTDRNGARVLNADVLAAAIADACALIDLYLAEAGYVLPLRTVPTALIKPACVLTRCNLYDDKRTEQVDADCKSALAWLASVGQGKVSIPGLEKPSANTNLAAGTRSLVYNATFYEQYTL